MVPAAHATDGGGSIRIPASWCGLFGLKPTRARNPVGPDTGEGWSGLGVGHAVTRSVRDSAALLDTTQGPEPGAPYQAPPPARPFLQEVGADPGRLRIALATKAPTGVRLHPDVIAAAEEAGRLCAGLGHHVEEAVPDLDGEAMAWAYHRVIGVNLANLIELRGQALGRPIRDDDFEPITRLWAEASRGRSAIEYTRMTQIIHATGRRLARFFERYDVLLSPTVGQPAPRIGEISMQSHDLDRYIAQVWDLVPFTLMINYAGTPAATLPLHWSASGMPVGVQIATPFGDEATIFRLASQLEQARPWFYRRALLGR
jgi:Asp-tRNA(Asn)/Glu-tRNA(Gln) amidotransferase A subunit family amidase